MNLEELIEDNLAERDLIEVIDKLNLDHSGSKEGLIEKLLNGIEGKSTKEVLSLFSSQLLIRICKANGIQQDWPFFIDSNELMIKKIGSRVLNKNDLEFDRDRSKLQTELSIPIKEGKAEPYKSSFAETGTKAVGSPLGANSDFEVVVRDIEGWLPWARHETENDYRADLNPWLWSRGHHTSIRKGDSTIDVLVDDKYPVVIIIDPDLSDFHRAFGQIHRHLERFKSVIMVICRPTQVDELEYFEERVRRSLTFSKYPYEIVIKN